MLRETKQLLAERGPMSLRELALHFQTEPDALEPMLNILLKKGQLELAAAGCGATCRNCSHACREDALIYQLPEE